MIFVPKNGRICTHTAEQHMQQWKQIMDFQTDANYRPIWVEHERQWSQQSNSGTVWHLQWCRLLVKIMNINNLMPKSAAAIAVPAAAVLMPMSIIMKRLIKNFWLKQPCRKCLYFDYTKPHSIVLVKRHKITCKLNRSCELFCRVAKHYYWLCSLVKILIKNNWIYKNTHRNSKAAPRVTRQQIHTPIYQPRN